MSVWTAMSNVFLVVACTLGFATAYTQIGVGTTRRLAARKNLSDVQGHLPQLLYICAVLWLVRGLELGASTNLYWVYIDLQVIILLYSNLLVPTLAGWALIQLAGASAFATTGGFTWITGPIYLACCLTVYATRWWGPWLKRHRYLYLATPMALGGVFWLVAAVQFPMVTPVMAAVNFLGFAWAYLALGDYDHYLQRDQQVLARLTREVQYDGLTQVRNWAMFQRDFSAAYADNEVRPVALVALDIDHFKAINDTYGHLTGNRVLMMAAGELRRLLYVRDPRFHVYRTGGEEFALILPGVDLAGATAIVRECQAALRRMPVPVDERVLHVTGSWGLVMATPADGSATAVFKRADQSLYHAKNTGRDRLTIEGRADVPDSRTA